MNLTVQLFLPSTAEADSLELVEAYGPKTASVALALLGKSWETT